MTESDSARRRQPADAGDDFFESLYRPEPRVERCPGDEPDASPAAEPTTSEPDAVRPAQAAPASPERAGQPAARPEPAEDDPDDTLRQPAVAGRAAPAPAEEGARPAARPAVLASVTVVLTAVVFLGFWFLQQFLYGALSLAQTSQTGGVAWWAHIGGFAAGFALVWPFQRRDRAPRKRDDWWQGPYGGRPVRGW